jgi:hypothetical protein
MVFDPFVTGPRLAVKFDLVGGNLQFHSPLLPFLPGKLALASFELDQFFLRLKIAVASVRGQLSGFGGQVENRSSWFEAAFYGSSNDD